MTFVSLGTAAMMYQYFLKIVPTQFNFMDGRSLRTFQYSTSRQERNLRQYPVGGLPGNVMRH